MSTVNAADDWLQKSKRIFESNLSKHIQAIFFIIEKTKETLNFKVYQRQLNSNKNSITKCYEAMIRSFAAATDIKIVFTMMMIIHRNRKFDSVQAKKDGRK